MLLGIPRSARCVQRLDDSLNSAIHINYRVSLRSSSMGEPRDPLSKVVFLFLSKDKFTTTSINSVFVIIDWVPERHFSEKARSQSFQKRSNDSQVCGNYVKVRAPKNGKALFFNNDPTAGSPTVTLL